MFVSPFGGGFKAHGSSGWCHENSIGVDTVATGDVITTPRAETETRKILTTMVFLCASRKMF